MHVSVSMHVVRTVFTVHSAEAYIAVYYNESVLSVVGLDKLC